MPATTNSDSTAAPTPDPVQICASAFHRAYSAEKEKGINEYDAAKKGSEAYRNAIPRLTSYANLRDFIACVTYGMLCHVIPNNDGTKLLYASQVALGALNSQPKPEGQETT